MEQREASSSNRYHHILSNLDDQGMDVEGPDMESLEDDFKSLLIVPSNSIHSDVKLLSDEVEIHSDVEVSSFDNLGWCKITRNSDICSASLENKSLKNFAEETDVPTEDTIISDHDSNGYLSYRFKMKSLNASSKKLFKVINYPKKPRSKRSRKRLMPEEDNNGTDLTCAQCGTEYGGFQCSKNTVHLQCHACEGMMPFRTNIHVPQHCIECDRAFYGVYLQSQLITKGDSYHTCTLKPIGEHSITGIPLVAHERNRHEQDITERCIQQMGKTLQDVVSEWVTKLNNGEIDRARMPLNNAEMINSGTQICSDCYDKLVSFLLYWFRTCLPKYHLPKDAAGREDCWYGYTCRTQHHNGDHARKRNHVCPPTKGGIGD